MCLACLTHVYIVQSNMASASQLIARVAVYQRQYGTHWLFSRHEIMNVASARQCVLLAENQLYYFEFQTDFIKRLRLVSTIRPRILEGMLYFCM